MPVDALSRDSRVGVYYSEVATTTEERARQRLATPAWSGGVATSRIGRPTGEDQLSPGEKMSWQKFAEAAASFALNSVSGLPLRSQLLSSHFVTAFVLESLDSDRA